MAKIIFASHGDLAKGMKNSVSMIAGSLADDVETYCLYPGENPTDYYQELRERVQECQDQVIILADIKGGSVHTALMPLTVFENVVLISGMNMAMALDVVLQYREGIQESEFDALITGSQSGITLMHGIKEQEDEEF
ncbi:PTS sugar transporter subunit IIA [Floccifex sp.]|uniref:PTS sugar transporter subunit IIA n=1 Tax=Floccifex sp. TaxID=2815810 RepID=UPI0029FF067C|nr:hypothetical protein [Floccifex sp.]MDD7280439.1 PTS sugar transporter subunit IIA [Erysipelotrichaceae bacterium]MDY2957459.1 PTS sugar transporter subunit IIA [Floccifex sp.]